MVFPCTVRFLTLALLLAAGANSRNMFERMWQNSIVEDKQREHPADQHYRTEDHQKNSIPMSPPMAVGEKTGQHSRNKRSPFVDHLAAWRTILAEFPPMIEDIQENAAVRMDAERMGVNVFSPSDRQRRSPQNDQELMAKSKMEDKSQRTNPAPEKFDFKYRIFKRETFDKEMWKAMRRAADAFYFSDKFGELNRDPAMAVDRMKAEKPLDEAFHSALGNQHTSYTEDLAILQKGNMVPGEDKKRTTTTTTRLRRAALSPEMLHEVKQAHPEFELEADILREVERDVAARDQLDKAMMAELKAAVEGTDFASQILQASASPEEALAKIAKAEKEMDEALHMVLGTDHVSDELDAAVVNNMVKDKLLKKLDVGDDVVSEDLLEALYNGVPAGDKARLRRREMGGDGGGGANWGNSNISPDVGRIMEAAMHKSVNKFAMANEKSASNLESVYESLIEAERELDGMLHVLHSQASQGRGSGSRTGQDISMQGILQVEQDLNNLMKELNAKLPSTPRTRRSADDVFMDGINVGGGSPDFSTLSAAAAAAPAPTASDPWYSPTRPTLTNGRLSLQDVVDALKSVRYVIPNEVEAAAVGALEVGRHFGSRLQPLVRDSYHTVASQYLPRARQTVEHVVDSVPEDLKDLARQSGRVVSSRARDAYATVQPRISRLQERIQSLGSQINQVAEEAAHYTSHQLVPGVGSTVRGVVEEWQRALDRANRLLVPSWFKQKKEELPRPSPYQTYNDYILSSARNSGFREGNIYNLPPPAYSSIPYFNRPSEEFDYPVYTVAADYAQTAAKEASTLYSNIASNTRQVLEENVKPALKAASHQVAESAQTVSEEAAKFGSRFQSEVVPPIQETVKSALHGVFTGIPTIVEKASSEANDAAQLFRGKYSEKLVEFNSADKIKQMSSSSSHATRENAPVDTDWTVDGFTANEKRVKMPTTNEIPWISEDDEGYVTTEEEEENDISKPTEKPKEHVETSTEL